MRSILVRKAGMVSARGGALSGLSVVFPFDIAATWTQRAGTVSQRKIERE